MEALVCKAPKHRTCIRQPVRHQQHVVLFACCSLVVVIVYKHSGGQLEAMLGKGLASVPVIASRPRLPLQQDRATCMQQSEL